MGLAMIYSISLIIFLRVSAKKCKKRMETVRSDHVSVLIRRYY